MVDLPPDERLMSHPDSALWAREFIKMLAKNPEAVSDHRNMQTWFSAAFVAGAAIGRENAVKEAARSHPRGPVIDAVKESQEALEGRLYAMNATLTAILTKLDEFE